METSVLPEHPDAKSPAGADIRYLVGGKTGNMIHSTVPAHRVNIATVHATVTEFWYVLEGQGSGLLLAWSLPRRDQDDQEFAGRRRSLKPLMCKWRTRAVKANKAIARSTNASQGAGCATPTKSSAGILFRMRYIQTT